jgi:hypothetical protein
MTRRRTISPWRAAAVTLLAVAAGLISHSASAAARTGPPVSNTSSTDWTTYQHDNAHSGFQPSDPAINASSAGTLAPKWIFRANDSIVRLSGTASSPSLTFVERGLVPAEHKLGLVSPFNVGGHPLVVPIQHVKSLVGC